MTNTVNVALVREGEMEEFDKYMQEFGTEFLKNDLDDPSLNALAVRGSTAFGAFFLWKMLTKGTVS